MVDHPRSAHAGQLTMDDGQSVYWEESARSDGIPAIYLHGGPGSGLGKGAYTARFDSNRFRVIGIDQRGCGRSLPLATDPRHDLDANTTQRLIADMEQLRVHLGVGAWLLNGVSWGSTLALAYAQEHPGRVLGIVLVAVTTTSRTEVEWITERMGAIYPEGWERFAQFAEDVGIGYVRGQGRVVDAYARLLRDPDPERRLAAANAWAEWEDTHVAIGAGGFHRDPRWQDPVFTETFATLTTHYWAHDGFLSPPILDRMDRIAHIPGVLIHGRLDVSGPLVTAWRLNRAWPDSELKVVEADGHGGETMGREWSDANSRLADHIGDDDRRMHQ